MLGATVPGALNAGPTPSFSVINPPPAYAPTPMGGAVGAPSTSVTNTTSSPIMGPSGPFAALGPQLSASAGNSLTAGQQALTTSMDPQQALYDRTLQQTQQQQNAAMQSTGMAGSPYGAGIDNQALTDFNIGWQDTQLGRQKTGIEANAAAMAPATGLYDQTYGGTTSTANTTAGQPYYPPLPALSGGSTGAGAPTGALPGSGTGAAQQAPQQQAPQPFVGWPAPGQPLDSTGGMLTPQGLNYQQNTGDQSLASPMQYFDAQTGSTSTPQAVSDANASAPAFTPPSLGGTAATDLFNNQNFGGMGATPPGSMDTSTGQPSTDWVPQSMTDIISAMSDPWWTGGDLGGASGY